MPMIVREWRARATRDGAAAYQAHARSAVLPTLGAIDGHMGHLMTARADGEDIEIVVLTFWRDMDSIRAFAGDDPETAVVEPAAHAALMSCDDRGRHAEAWSCAIESPAGCK
jgi:heme-degrading monooxygenase HmoA